MEPTHSYQCNTNDKITEQSDSDQDLFRLADLDPSFEHSFDLQKLIDETNTDISQHVEVEHPSLTATFEVGDFGLECETKVGFSLTDAPNETNEHDLLNLVADTSLDTSSFEYMTQGEEIAPDSGLGVATVKTEDLELLSCQSVSSSTTPPLTQNSKSGRKPPGITGKGRKRHLEKNSDAYIEKRAKNNVAVRKSRDKAKYRQNETEGRVFELTDENELLQKKVDLLTKELNVLKSLFINVGASIPDAFKKIMEDSEQ